MSQSRVMRMIAVIVILSMVITPIAHAEVQTPAGSDGPVRSTETATLESPRLIVELDSEPLAAAYVTDVTAAAVNGKLDANSAAAQAYINQLRAEQAVFVSNMQAALADATVATFRNEAGVTEEATYQIVFNGLAVNPGATPKAEALRTLAKLPGVKNVYFDTPHYTQLYTSTTLINAPIIWNTVGGRANGGAGIKVASMDGGVHNQAAMMNGAGYSYPPGYGPNGLGLTANNNGKIIASRAYFRTWDPPAAGDENPWPGKAGTSHGMHTSSTAAGGIVTATYSGLNVGTISGVAPKAYVMSYRVFYGSVNGIGSFYTTEGIAALEDIVQDGADVVNNSWGGGPGSIGGEFDPLDTALINATKAGIFVSMSNGNAGPGIGTSDHPSPHYINVAASTTGGSLASGVVNVTKPTPTNANLQKVPYGTADFGPALAIGQSKTYSVTWAGTVSPGNINGCAAFPANAFANAAALISRGSCSFSDKVFNAQQAGATFVVIYDNASNVVQGMSCASHCLPGEITISSIRITKAKGDALVNWVQTHGAATAIEVNTIAFQEGNTPDQIIGFSSRGPGVGGTLKPDIAAPGVNILAQGYTEGATGEARHLGYGQVSGTSMAAPHISGAAALLQQIHPTWPVAAIKSALMSTSKYLGIYLDDGVTPAQPLDMGAGRLDLSKAADPGVILDPPSLSFGFVPTGTQKTITVTVTSVASAAETYALSTLYTGDGFAPTQTTTLPGVTANVASLSLNPGESKKVAITFNSTTGMGIGDNQGYVIMDGPTHDAHMPAWARVVPATPVADVLLIDGDFSTTGASLGFPNTDYRWYYIDALDQLSYTYSILDYKPTVTVLPDAATLSGYKAIVYFTGDNFVNGGGLTDLDMNKLVEYLNAGGSVIVMGQDMAATIDNDATDPGNPDFFYSARLGANWIQDSVSDNVTPQNFIRPTSSAPTILADVVVDLTRPRQLLATGPLSGTQEVPPVNTLTKGSFSIFHDIDSNYTEFRVTVTPSTTQPITVTGMHIHVGAAGVNGPVIRNLASLGGVTLPKFITNTLRVSGVISPSLNVTEVQQMVNGGLYINVHTTVNPPGAIRGQIEPEVLENQAFVDEIDNHAHDGSEDPNGDDNFTSTPILYYQGPNNLFNGTVAMGHRLQPSLEEPGITYSGRSVYATFGLEGMSNRFNATAGITPTTRSELLGAFLDWTWAPAATTVQITNTVATSSTLQQFSAAAAYGLQQRSAMALSPKAVQYRWDFGDGSPYVLSVGSQASHQYLCGADNSHTLRVEITDNYGNVVIGSKEIDVSKSCATNIGPKSSLYLPLVRK